MNKIRTIFLDVDGTLTNGQIYYNSNGEEIKAFNIKDGLIISAMRKVGYNFVVITGRQSNLVERRLNELGVYSVFQGVADKEKFADKYIVENNLNYDECAYIGDDLNDIAVMKKTRFKACPFDACDEIKECSDFVSQKDGGCGAVREILEKILINNGDWMRIIELFS